MSELARQSAQFVPIRRISFMIFYRSPSNFFKIARTVYGVIIFQDFAAPSFKMTPLIYRLTQSGHPVLTNGKLSFVQCTRRSGKEGKKSWNGMEPSITPPPPPPSPPDKVISSRCFCLLVHRLEGLYGCWNIHGRRDETKI